MGGNSSEVVLPCSMLACCLFCFPIEVWCWSRLLMFDPYCVMTVHIFGPCVMLTQMLRSRSCAQAVTHEGEGPRFNEGANIQAALQRGPSATYVQFHSELISPADGKGSLHQK